MASRSSRSTRTIRTAAGPRARRRASAHCRWLAIASIVTIFQSPSMRMTWSCRLLRAASSARRRVRFGVCRVEV
eukprot:1410632-Alexandrium_andersonii.AAC.1